MCGIAGIVHFDGRPVDRTAIERMTGSLAHRGPDAAGIWIDEIAGGMVGFGHRRLSIRDPSARAGQPMLWGEGGTAVTYNGEIYNDGPLRRRLEAEHGCVFRTTCDTEIIGPAYRHWGAACFGRFEGMFALALWDGDRGELVLARDPVGIKPLYYSIEGQTIRFASEVKALITTGAGEPRLDPQALHCFLGQGYPGPLRSLVAGIQPVPPGSVLIAGREGVRVERYWQPRRSGEIADLADAVAEFEPLWRQVVEDHLVSDVPVGLLLSGGIDSSLVAAALGGGENRISAFTAGFADAAYDESAAAAATARRFGLPHRTVAAAGIDGAAERFLSVVAHYDGQCADSSGFAFHAVCAAAARGHKVVLTGDGADEFFGGYETYRATRIAALLRPVMQPGVARGAARLFRSTGAAVSPRVPASEKLARLLSGIAEAPDCPHPQWRRYAFPDHVEALYAAPLRAAVEGCDPLGDYADAVRGAEGGLLDRCLVADQNYYLPGDLLMKSDAMSMAHGVEVRVPFLDRRIMEFAGRLHISLLTPFRGPDKRLLRVAASRLGVPAAVTRGRKRGFNVPVAALLRGALKPLGDALLAEEPDVLAPYLEADGVRRLWQAHQSGRANHGYVLWTLLTLAAWRAGWHVGAHHAARRPALVA